MNTNHIVNTIIGLSQSIVANIELINKALVKISYTECGLANYNNYLDPKLNHSLINHLNVTIDKTYAETKPLIEDLEVYSTILYNSEHYNFA